MNGNQRDANFFEDILRQLLGMEAYVMFTFDKAVSSTAKTFTQVINDKLSINLWKLFKKYEDAPSQYREEIYYNDFLRSIQPTHDEIFVRMGKHL